MPAGYLSYAYTRHGHGRGGQTPLSQGRVPLFVFFCVFLFLCTGLRVFFASIPLYLYFSSSYPAQQCCQLRSRDPLPHSQTGST